MDVQGLQNTYLTLGQIDEALKVHIEDARKAALAAGVPFSADPFAGIYVDLEDASLMLRSSQRILGRVVKALA